MEDTHRLLSANPGLVDFASVQHQSTDLFVPATGKQHVLLEAKFGCLDRVIKLEDSLIDSNAFFKVHEPLAQGAVV